MNYFTRFLAPIGEYFSIFTSASAVAGALRVRKQPHPADLRRLGMEHADFSGYLNPGAIARVQSSSEESIRSTAPLPRIRKTSGASTAAAVAA